MEKFGSISGTFKYWWVLLATGLVFILLSILILINPVESLLELTVFFSIAWLVGGISQVIFSLANRKTIKDWVFYLLSGLVDMLLGFLLLTRPEMSIFIVLLIVGIWLVFKGVTLLVIGINLKRNENRWAIIAGGILTILISFVILGFPTAITFGIMIWMGICTLAIGILFLLLSFITRRAYKHINEKDNNETQEFVSK